jgi:hypothetical protein
MIANQNKMMSAHSEQIYKLTSEVDALKSKATASSGSQAKDERIRELELELEQARS